MSLLLSITATWLALLVPTLLFLSAVLRGAAIAHPIQRGSSSARE